MSWTEEGEEKIQKDQITDNSSEMNFFIFFLVGGFSIVL